MNKEQLIKMIENLKAIRNSSNIKKINSLCDRLAFNFNMLPDSANYLENCIAEAELWLSK